MTVGVIHILEVVDVHQEKRKRAFISDGPEELPFENLHEITVIEEPR